MGLLWPGFLLLLGIIPLAVAIYIWALRRRRRFAVRFSSLSLVRMAAPQQSAWRRHLPFALFLLALTCLVIALVRPVAVVNLPVGQTTVILAMDVSKSMCSIDIPPNRLVAAEGAAVSFVRRQPAGVRVGVVAFAGFAALVQPPTDDERALVESIENLTTGYRTAIGSAILESVNAIAELNPNVPAIEENAAAGSNDSPGSSADVAPAPEGTYQPDIIVLLSDGASNAGPLPLDAARLAAERGVRIYTIGFGTYDGSMMDCGDGFQSGWGFNGGGGGQFGNDPLFGGWFRRGIDEPTLRQVAAMTGGEYYSAESAGELQAVFEKLPSYLTTIKQTNELSVLFVAAAVALIVLALVLSMLWNPLL